MAAVFPLPEQLPTRSSSQVKNSWAEVARQVRESGSVAVTNHSTVEMVLIDTAAYRKLVEEVAAVRAKEADGLMALESAFDARLAALQAPEAHDGVDALFVSRGKLKRSIKAGTSF